MHKVFLGGTCNDSSWRYDVIKRIKIPYFNPVVDDWTEECQVEEQRQKNCFCDIHLYVITPMMSGVYSIAEAVESAINKGRKCIFCFLEKDGGYFFTPGQIKSLKAVGEMITSYGGKWARNLDGVVDYINNYKEDDAINFNDLMEDDK